MQGEEIKTEVRELLASRAPQGKITCEEARKIAEWLGIPYAEVGRAADLLRIKITSCGLGCF